MTDVQATQTFASSVTALEVDVNVSQTFGLAVYNVPTKALQMSQTFGVPVVIRPVDVEVSGLHAVAVVRGRTANPYLRVWQFQLDGHDFYVLNLGDEGTFVWDAYSKQWSVWRTEGLKVLRARTGYNWVGGSMLGPTYGSNVIVGDDVSGMLYILDPNQPHDDPAFDDRGDIQYFTRTVTGQVPLRGREALPCYTTWLTADYGRPAYIGAAVDLQISDDDGLTYYSMGKEIVPPGDYNWNATWYSLGHIRAPGRLFRIIDDGAVARIDTLEMQDPPETDKDEVR